MTWFRAGGGNGIPNQLKSNMDAVLNKKFGTSTTYPPGGWPDDVNLLGVLEEKTTTKSAIAHITDGADEVPIKSWEVEIAPTLTGKSAVEATQTEKNLYDYDGKVYNGEFYDASGNVVQYADCAVSWIKCLPSTKYTFTCTKDTSQTVNVRIAWCKADKSFISRQGLFSDNQFPMTLTTPSNCEWIQLSVNQYGAALIAQNDWKIQVEQSASPTTYEAYNGTTSTVNLGRTIYGGSVDVVNGTGIDYGLWVNMSDIAWTEDTNRAGVFYGSVSGRKSATADEPSDVLGCTCYDVNNVNVTTGIDNYISGARSYGGNLIFFRDSSFHGYTRAQVQEALQGEKVCVVSANPTDFTFTPISPTPQTKLGVNNFWSDGDSQVTYRSSGTETIVAPDLTTKSITANGTYNASSDNADGYSQVTVNVPTTPIISETDWNNLTDAQKRTYGLVIIQQANSGYKRGIYVNGADYPVLEEYSDILTTGLSLDVVPNVNYTIECCFYASQYINDGHVCGTTSGNHRNFHVTTYNNMWYFEGDVGKANNSAYSVDGGMDITFRCEGTTAYMNGYNLGTIGRVDGGTSYALAQRGSAITGNNYKYKYFKIWDENDNLIHDFRFMANKTMIDLVTLNTKTYT